MTLLANEVKAQHVTPEKRAFCVGLLQKTITSELPFFIRVHAAEALIFHGHSEGLEKTFTDLQHASPDYFVGASRVLARLRKTDPGRYEATIRQILDVFLHAETFRSRLVALESLGKLGYANPLTEIEQQARDGKDGMQGMARWVLANSGRAKDEARLAELLRSADPLAYRYAAYALRFQPNIRPATYALLEACAKRLQPDDTQRVYVLSACFVHAPSAKRPQAHDALLNYVAGTVAERYEVAEALGIRGDHTDISTLEGLLADSDPDVRVAAAHALLRLGQVHLR